MFQSSPGTNTGSYSVPDAFKIDMLVSILSRYEYRELLGYVIQVLLSRKFQSSPGTNTGSYYELA